LESGGKSLESNATTLDGCPKSLEGGSKSLETIVSTLEDWQKSLETKRRSLESNVTSLETMAKSLETRNRTKPGREFKCFRDRQKQKITYLINNKTGPNVKFKASLH
jgi:hypothetical protein